jgi:DMSO/TMAO reductase YedYZ molybdopterin-dependent catalytic subunit
VGTGTAVSLLPGSAHGGTFLLKKLFSLPPRDTKPITPNHEFYVVTYSPTAYRMVQNPDLGRWRLEIGGNVARPLALTYDDLLRRPAIHRIVTLQCVENPVGGDSMSNAIWTGIPLKDLLDQAGPRPGIRDVVFYGADGYTESIPFDRVRSAPEGAEVLLAYRMNGVSLPPEHGYPLRAVVPGIYGMKSAKWLSRIELVDEEFLGYWQQRGWSDEGRVQITSRIDAPGAYQEVDVGAYTVRGLAFSGTAGIGRVEISTDGGRRWNPCLQDPPLSNASWVLWRYPWLIPGPGEYRLIVRATDGSGRPQIAAPHRAFPEGATGLHEILVEAELPRSRPKPP